jgi:seryl-tRNA synthetase
MIDIQDLRQRPDVYQDAADKKNIKVSVKGFLSLDETRRGLVKDVDEMRAEKNRVSKEVPQMKGDEKEKAIKDMKALGETLKAKEAELETVEKEWRTMQLLMPSLPLSTVPVGKDDSQNVEVAKWGAPPTFAFEPKDHVALGEALDLFDIARGVKIAGSRSYFLKGDGARLYLAVMRFAIEHLTAKGWTLFIPPYMANWECLMGTGFFPGAEDQTYSVGAQQERGGPMEGDDLYLIGTSEVSVASYHKDEILHHSALPTRYAGYSPCFRREAGTYGKDTRGLYRVHQFEKVEQVVLCEADQEKALAMFEEIRVNAEEVLRMLGLSYRIVDVCTGDMGKGKVFMQDIETWMPSRNMYSETQSCSYLGSFQARRLNIQYETPEGKKEFVHTLNNTCIAGPRILIPILETYQNADGTVTVPEALRPHMGGQSVLSPK